MTAATDWQDVRLSIGRGDLTTAISRLELLLAPLDKALYNEILTQSARAADLHRRESRGLLTDAAASVERNRIAAALLDLVDEASQRFEEDARRRTGESGRAAASALTARVHTPRPAGHAASVFISYARDDDQRARMLFDRLLKHGFDPWMDVDGLRVGEEWERRLRSKINECDYFIVLQSEQLARRSFSFVRMEVELALAKQSRARTGVVYVLPLLLDDCLPMDELRHLQNMPLRDDADFDALVRAIREDFERRET